MELWILMLFGGVVALDTTSFGQFMISRPLVAGTLAGAILGDAAGGLIVGGLLELFHLVSFPVGGARFPEAGPAAIVAAAVVVPNAGPGGYPAGALAVAVLLGLLWGQLGGASLTLLRRVNGWLAPDPDDPDLSVGSVTQRHLAAMGVDFARGVGLTGAGVLLAEEAGAALAWMWPLGLRATLGFVLLAAAMPLGVLFRAFGGERRRMVFASGLAAGVLGGMLL